MDELIKDILSKIRYSEEDSIVSDTVDIKGLEIKKENFLDIVKKGGRKKIAFVDGGNLEIIKSPSLSVFFNRVYYVIYKDNERVKDRMFEFYSVINATQSNGRILFCPEYFFMKDRLGIPRHEFDSMDPLLRVGSRRAPISSIGDIIRRFAELQAAKEIDDDCIIILDGSLETRYPYEDGMFDGLNDSKNIICGLSKTSSSLTCKGSSVSAYLANMAEKNTWIYDAGIMGRLHIYFLKLHPRSDYVFRFEADARKGYGLQEIAGLLSENSMDPVFLGYPYGLVDADRFARVSNKEGSDLKLGLLMRFKKDIDKIKPLIKSLDAHSILDSMG